MRRTVLTLAAALAACVPLRDGGERRHATVADAATGDAPDAFRARDVADAPDAAHGPDADVADAPDAAHGPDADVADAPDAAHGPDADVATWPTRATGRFGAITSVSGITVVRAGFNFPRAACVNAVCVNAGVTP